MMDSGSDFKRLVEAMGATRAHVEASDAGWIRSNHHHAFRSGEWARILSIAPAPGEEHDCYVVEFSDGKTDWWVVDDPAAEYEFSGEARPSENQ